MIARFRADLANVWPEGDEGISTLHIAISGGPDSVALLLLANAALPSRVRAATVDHGLRQESAHEAVTVAKLCETIGIPHAILAAKVGPGNLQNEARLARYAALDDWLAGAASLGDALATAHQADDQAETLLMRLNRASGLAGLAGIRSRRMLELGNGNDIALVRPLLGWRRHELAEVCRAAGVEPAQDPSNEDLHYDRVRIRKELRECNWIDPLAVAESAEHLTEAWELIEAFAEREWQQRVTEKSKEFVYNPGHDRIISIEVMRRIIEALGGSASRTDIATMHDRLRRGENASLGGVLASVGAAIDGASGEKMSVWHFCPEPPRAS